MRKGNKKHLKKNPAGKKALRILLTVFLTCVFLAIAAFAVYKSFPIVYGKPTFIGATRYSLKDAGVTDFTELYTLRRLTSLDIRGNDVTEEMYSQLKKDWPQCEIIWDAPIDGKKVDSSSQILEFETIPADFENIKYFPSLQKVVIYRPSDQEEMLSLRDSYPQYSFSWSVLMNEEWYAPDTKVLDLKETDELYSEMKSMLKYFQNLETVNIEGNSLDVYKQLELIELFPELDFNWSVVLWNETFNENSEEISLVMDKNPDLEEFDAAIHVFPALKTVKLAGNKLTTALQSQLLETYPQINFIWDVKVWNETFSQNAETITLTVSQRPDLKQLDEALNVFTSLKTINMSGDKLNVALQNQLLETYPQINFVWNVKVWGETFGQNEESITLSPVKEPDMQEFEDALSVFTSLKNVTINGSMLTTTVQKNLLEKHPELKFTFTVVLGKDTFSQNTAKLTLSPESSPSLEELEDSLSVFDRLEEVDFTNSGVPGAVRISFRDRHPDINVSWRVFIMGQEYPLDTQTLDFSNMQLTDEDVESIRTGTAQLPELTRVDMHYCGVDDEVMNEMNISNERTRFVWTVQFSGYEVRTDAKFFMPGSWENGAPLFNSNSYKLKYLIDLECLDLGHSHVEDLFFLQYMPHMKYLILVDSSVLSLEYVSYCKELLFLECFVTYIKDLSPLLECPSLEDLNIGYTRCNGDEAFDVLRQMTWLKRLWYCGTTFSREQINELKELLPDTEQYIRTGGQSTGSTWRYGKNYYDMRDLLGLDYLPGGTMGGNYEGWQVIEDDAGVRFVLANWDYRQDWWTQDEFKYWDVHIVGITCTMEDIQ